MSTPFELLDGGKPSNPDDEFTIAEGKWELYLGWLEALRDSGAFPDDTNLFDPDDRRRCIQWLEDEGILERDMPTTPEIEAFAKQTGQTVPAMRMSAVDVVFAISLTSVQKADEAIARTALFTDEDEEVNLGHRPSTIGGTT